jgi:hypothetical protein
MCWQYCSQMAVVKNHSGIAREFRCPPLDNRKLPGSWGTDYNLRVIVEQALMVCPVLFLGNCV